MKFRFVAAGADALVLNSRVLGDHPILAPHAASGKAVTIPNGVNVEFVHRIRPGHIAMRVHERGSGETRSCGTGACAAAVATALECGVPQPVRYQVDVPGGRLVVRWDVTGQVDLSGPAQIVARGEWLAA